MICTRLEGKNKNKTERRKAKRRRSFGFIFSSQLVREENGGDSSTIFRTQKTLKQFLEKKGPNLLVRYKDLGSKGAKMT